MDTLEIRIAAGLELERAGDEQGAIEHFRQVVADYPNDSRAWFEYAGAFDFAGQEAEAIPHYRRALAMGLDGDYLPRLYVQLGSSLRNVGAFDEAVALLDEGIARFPDMPALRVFRAYALESAGRSKAAITELLELAIRYVQTPDMQGYARAIRYYTDERAQ
ncbi:MAG: tetratricopeptide repeat protein [Anaerolineae bacterium]|nr:tetratricopeptide repeat protein [Anaerolineae bacterium]